MTDIRPAYRILVTGSRDWDDVHMIFTALHDETTYAFAAGRRPVIVHGACPTGADYIAVRWWTLHSEQCDIEPHRAEWKRYGASAGPRRNQEMVNAGAHVCLAFIKNGSHGATGTATMARKAGITTRVWADDVPTANPV